MIDHQILPFLSWLLALILNISLLLLPFYSYFLLRKQKPSWEMMKTRSMSNKPDQADDQKKIEGPQAGRRTTRQAANRTGQAIQSRKTGNVTTREPAAGNRPIGQKGREGGGAGRGGLLARNGLLQNAGGNPDKIELRNTLADRRRREMAPAPRPPTRSSLARKQLQRSDITATFVAPTEVISGSKFDARHTQAEVINNGGPAREKPAQEKKRHRGDLTSRSRSIARHFPGNTALRPRTRPRVNAIQNDLPQHPRERVRREIPQEPQPMSIDQPSRRIEGRANHESGSQQEFAQLNIQGQLQDTNAGIVSNQHSMPIQTNINVEFKARMLDYLKSMQAKGEMEQETFHLSKQLVDRYCSVAEISEDNWQLLAIAAMFVASKYEEVWPPKVSEFAVHRFLLSEVIRTEQLMLKALDYKITIPTPVDYVRRFIKVEGSVQEEKNLAFYLANLRLSELETRYSPAFIAAAAIYAARCRIRDAPKWTNKLEHHTGYTEGDIKDCALLMLQLQVRSNIV